MSTTRISLHINASRPRVYQALLDARAIQAWRAPTGMTSHVHEFDPREGGAFRISLTYDLPTGTGKTTAQTDTYHGRFAKIVPHEQIIETLEFETDDPAMQGEMTITYTLTDANGGTDLLAVHDRVPPGVPPEQNEIGWQDSLGKLAALVEAESHIRRSWFASGSRELSRPTLVNASRPARMVDHRRDDRVPVRRMELMPAAFEGQERGVRNQFRQCRAVLHGIHRVCRPMNDEQRRFHLVEPPLPAVPT